MDESWGCGDCQYVRLSQRLSLACLLVWHHQICQLGFAFITRVNVQQYGVLRYFVSLISGSNSSFAGAVSHPAVLLQREIVGSISPVLAEENTRLSIYNIRVGNGDFDLTYRSQRKGAYDSPNILWELAGGW